MGTVLTDPGFAAITWIVIDFEALTPAGRSPEPIEVAAIAGRFTAEGEWTETDRFHSLMRPPEDIPVTSFARAQTGITEQMLAWQPPADYVMAALDARLSSPPYRLVAHSAHTEGTLIAGQRHHCPGLAATKLLCTVKLSRLAFPELDNHKLDTVVRFLHIPIPAVRHRAMPDAELTVQVFRSALAAGQQRHLWTNLQDIEAAAGVARRNPAVRAPRKQDTLF